MIIVQQIGLGGKIRICDICGSVYRGGESDSLCLNAEPQSLTNLALKGEVVTLHHGEYSIDNVERRLVREASTVKEFWHATPNEAGTTRFQRAHRGQMLEVSPHAFMVRLEGRGGTVLTMSIDEMMIRMRGNEEEMERNGLILPRREPKREVGFWAKVRTFFSLGAAQNA
jgi:hypothetical protein